MNEKQKIVTMQKIYDHEVRVVTGCLMITADEDWEYRNEDGSILEQGKAGDLISTDDLLGKYGYEVFNNQGFQLTRGGGHEFSPKKFNTVTKALEEGIRSLKTLLEVTSSPLLRENREFYRPLSGWGETDDWVGDSEREDPRLSGNCWTCWKRGIGG